MSQLNSNFSNIRWMKDRWSWIFVVLVGTFGFLQLLSHPIKNADTDLWFHLSVGRYIAQNHFLPTDSFFSFVSPPYRWLAYSWLFDFLTYQIYLSWGYFGLIAVKSALYAGLVWIVARFSFKKQSIDSAILVSIVAAGFMGHYYLVTRPYIIDYMFIMLFLYILEMKRGWALGLPLLAVLWTNIHGIYFPVLFLICAAYLIQEVWEHYNGGRRMDRRVLFGTSLAFAGPLATPHCLNLLRLALHYGSQDLRFYATESEPLDWKYLVNMDITPFLPGENSLFSLVFVAAALAAVHGLRRKSLRPSHVILWLGGICLLPKGKRFLEDFILLSLPLLRASSIRFFDPGRRLKLPGIFLLACVLALPPAWICKFFSDLGGHGYPVDLRELPEGVCVFLNRLPSGGALLNHPDLGGYMVWRLYPEFKIFDVEISGLSLANQYLSQRAYRERTAFDRILALYKPPFVFVPRTKIKAIPFLRDKPGYHLVFIDDTGLLFADASQRPDVVERYGWNFSVPEAIHNTDPTNFVQELSAKDRDILVRRLSLYAEIYPASLTVQRMLTAALWASDRLEEALPHAEAIITHFPYVADGYALRADILWGRNAANAANALAKAAEMTTDSVMRARLLRKLGITYMKQGRPRDALAAFRKGIQPQFRDVTMEEFYHYVSAALRNGDTAQASRVLRFINEYRLPMDKPEWDEILAKDPDGMRDFKMIAP